MLSRVGSSDKNISKKKKDCTCASIKLDDRRNGERDSPGVDVDCSSHPGFCVFDENGMCTKRENAIHCAEVSLKSLGETLPKPKERNVENRKSCCDSESMSCNKKYHYYKIDLNNSEDTGLIADKQCQTCGPECSPATCSSRSREFFISWDKFVRKLYLEIKETGLLFIRDISSEAMSRKNKYRGTEQGQELELVGYITLNYN